MLDRLVASFSGRCLLAVVSGLIYSFAYPPVDMGWMVLFSVWGLLIALRGQQGSHARAIGFLFGLTAFALSLSWLFRIFGLVAILLWIVLAVFPALFAHFQGRAVLRGIRGWKLAVFTSLNWCGWEFIRAEVFPLKFPWMTAGLAIGPNAFLPWIGVYGVSAVVIFAAALFFQNSRKAGLAVVLALGVSGLFFRKLPETPATDSAAVKVAAIQAEDSSLDTFITKTRQLPPEIQQVVWPEYALPFDVRLAAHDWAKVQDLCKERGITLTFGTQSRPREGGWRNIALTVDPTGALGEHQKIHTVHFFDDGIAGTTAAAIRTTHGKIGTPICFDSDYENVIRRMTSDGAEAILIPTMDAAPWTALQHEQHAELPRIRAAENGRWILVCATSGVSQLIDPHGRVHRSLPTLQDGILSGIFRRETSLTFYTRSGWVTPWCFLALAGCAWLMLLLPVKKTVEAN